MVMARLAGRVVVVTGAGRGIGAAIARLCGAEGALVVVNDLGGSVHGEGRDPGPAAEVAAEITAGGGTALAHGADVASPEQAEDLVATAIREYGGLDVLVNVAGIVRDRMVFNMEPAEWDAVLNVHLKGTFNTTRIAAKHWREHQKGHYRLINTTSGAGLFGAPGQPNYAAAKLGIVGFTYSCANALMRYGVTANVLSPGATTRITSTIPDHTRLSTGSTTDRRRDTMTSENVAPVVAYLASEESDWCTGQVIGARGLSVSLYNRPHVIREFRGNTEETHLDDVWNSFERLFRPLAENSDNHYEVVARADAAKRRQTTPQAAQ
jgi:NAD(P)-dependent dehydrogenase (short-subunit alcohol dehydrogenase family)